jgi:L-threonylcarbamoyladenylate synthase
MMSAERIQLDDFLNDDFGNKRAVLKEIENGAVFVYPTETIYGIGGLTVGAFVYQRVLALKKRPPENPFILIASGSGCFSSLRPRFSRNAQLLSDCFWPGPLTIIVPCDVSRTDTALRVTDHPFIAEINNYFNFPLISTSANLSGEPYSGDPDHIFKLFSESVDFMFDAGFLPSSQPSTVVNASADSIEILRPGAITKEQIDACLRECVTDL